MPRIRYTPEEKENALRLCNAIGVVKASEQTGITTNSLYKWRSELEDETTVSPFSQDAGLAESESPSQESKASSRKRYTAEEKENALRLCSQLGITKASKETGITINSLRKWRADAQNEWVHAEAPVEENADQSASQTDNDSQSTAIIARLAKAPSEETALDEDTHPTEEALYTNHATEGDYALADNISQEQTKPLPIGKEANVDGAREELIRLQYENSALKAQITALKSALRVFTE